MLAHVKQVAMDKVRDMAKGKPMDAGDIEVRIATLYGL